jgi:hypothetical protein
MGKKVILLLAFFSFLNFEKSYGQKIKLPDKQNCSVLIEHLGYFWRLDSLANNGLRLFTYEKLLKSKIDSVTQYMLFKQLGLPNKTKDNGEKLTFIYYTWDTSKMPKEFNAPKSCSYIGFIFNSKSYYLDSIIEGDIDL